MNARRILDVVRESGDANLGQTLLRLARLAEANHRFQVATDLATRAHDDARHSIPATDVSGRIDGNDSRESQTADRTEVIRLHYAMPRSSSVCTEVNR